VDKSTPDAQVQQWPQRCNLTCKDITHLLEHIVFSCSCTTKVNKTTDLCMGSHEHRQVLRMPVGSTTPSLACRSTPCARHLRQHRRRPGHRGHHRHVRAVTRSTSSPGGDPPPPGSPRRGGVPRYQGADRHLTGGTTLAGSDSPAITADSITSTSSRSPTRERRARGHHSDGQRAGVTSSSTARSARPTLRRTLAVRLRPSYWAPATRCDLKGATPPASSSRIWFTFPPVGDAADYELASAWPGRLRDLTPRPWRAAPEPRWTFSGDCVSISPAATLARWFIAPPRRHRGLR
jgi:hypothetical protein